MKNKVRILADGISNNTKIWINDKPLTNVVKIEILPIEANDELVQVKLTLEDVILDIKGEIK